MSRNPGVCQVRLSVLFAIAAVVSGGSVVNADDPFDGPAPPQVPAPPKAPQVKKVKKEVVQKAAKQKAAENKPDPKPPQPKRKPKPGEVRKAGDAKPAEKGAAVPAWLKKFVKNMLPAAGPNRPAMIPKNIGNTIDEDSVDQERPL